MFPGRGKGSRPGIAAIEIPCFVGALETAPPEATHHDVFANAQQHHIGIAVAVDVERVRARHLVQFEPAGLRLEPQRPGSRAGIAVEFGGRSAAGKQHVVEAVGIAVERGDATADHVFPLPGVDAVYAGAGGLLDETGDGDAALGSGQGRNAGDGEGGQGKAKNHETHAYFLVRNAFV